MIQQTSWAPKTIGIVWIGIAGLAMLLVAVTVVTDLPGRVLGGVAALGLLLFATASWRARPKLAITDAGLDEPFCQPELLALESTARERRLGLWADDRYKPMDVDQPERLRDRIGSFVLVEGRVRSIGERKQRTYLNFGGLWAEDFTIIIPRKTWKQMSDRGMGAEALKGQRIRARGILRPWQGTAFSIVIPDMIERLEGSRLPR